MVPTNLDREGRFLLPEKLKYFAEIKNEVTLYRSGLFFSNRES